MRKQMYLVLTSILVITMVMGGWTACSDKNDDNDDLTRLQIVSIPDFFFSSNEIQLASTFDTRAEPKELVLQADEQLVVKDNVNIRLTVAEDRDEFIALKHWEAGKYRAAKLSIQMHTATDVMVFLPISSQYFCYNSEKALEEITKLNANMEYKIRPQTSIATKLKAVYGEASMSCLVSDYKAVATVTYGKTEDGVEGIEVLITGVTNQLLKSLQNTYKDGLTIDVWCYFKNSINRLSMREIFNEGATVVFSKKPAMYGNMFSMVRDYPDKVYSKTDATTGMIFPYKDEDCQERLESKYWIRPAEDDGTPSLDFLLYRHKYEWDCTVAYQGITYAMVFHNNADVPADVATKFYVLPNNYNTYFFDKYEIEEKEE